ncbi:hypothetical protein AVEN_37262-1 [Araneus ventricosus]|uniref:Uncharacterized protein n=1 Tax=Araneus ventricosus TaxID=182803 RepID=A0A4Y2KL51_ARAVE|nr:hypothetical protein AVEN_37262-1 [Araneus ventricosus]
MDRPFLLLWESSQHATSLKPLQYTKVKGLNKRIEGSIGHTPLLPFPQFAVERCLKRAVNEFCTLEIINGKRKHTAQG